MAAQHIVYGAGTAPHFAPVATVASSAQELVVRRLGAPDLPSIEAHLLALEPGDRTRRFHGLLGDDAMRGYFGRIDFARLVRELGAPVARSPGFAALALPLGPSLLH